MKPKLLFIAVALVALCFSGCEQVKSFVSSSSTSTSAYATSSTAKDPVVVNAEKVTIAADATFDAFLHLEYTNQAFVKTNAPQIHQFANYLRQPTNARAWLKSARSLTKAYKANRSPENKLQLQTVLSTLTEAANQAHTYATQLNKGV